MVLSDGLRQIVAGLLASAAFLALYFGLDLIWWAALGLAIAVYFALLLVIRRRPKASEIMLASRVSAADIRAADQLLGQSATRIEAVLPRVPASDRAHLDEMVGHLKSIRTHVVTDPQDFRRARRFIMSYLPNMVDTIEAYGHLSERAGPDHADRLARLGETIRSFGPAIDAIDRACLENDFDALEAEVSALATQMERG
jgi:hypothetical protein